MRPSVFDVSEEQQEEGGTAWGGGPLRDLFPLVLGLQSHLGAGHREGPSPEWLVTGLHWEEIIVPFLLAALYECGSG